MSVTTQPTTYSDLFTMLQNATRETTGVTATENQAKRAINVALHDMHLGFDYRYPWAERSAILITQAEYTTGTLTATKGSTTITGSSTLWNTANDFSINNMRAGGKIRINGGFEVYEISSIASDTSAVLTSRFTQDTVSGASYVYFEDEYALASDFLRPIDLRSFSEDWDIELIGRSEFRRRYVRNYITGKPSVACLLDKPFSGSTTPVRKVQFHKPPDQAYMIPYNYVTSNLGVTSAGTAQSGLSSDTDEPIVPLRYRHGIVLHALASWYRDHKDDTRANDVKGEYVDFMSRVIGDFETGASRPQIRPRIAEYARRARRPYS